MFLNPLMLLALGGIAAPILIHLLNRRRIEKVTWAAMRFLQNALKQNQRRMNIEDLLLLALRCLLIALIALAMARPAFRSPITKIFGQSKLAAVIVLDNSASTALSDGTISRFDQSKKVAAELISGFPRGSSVAVYLASDIPTALIAEPTGDLVLARQTVEQAQCSDRPTNWLPALTQAGKVLAGQSSLRKELYLVTDGQSLGLRQLEDIRAFLERNHNAIQTTFVLDGIPETHNLAVTDFKLADAQVAAQDRPASFDVQVTNFGSEAANDVHVALNLDRDPPAAESQIALIPPGESRSISLATKFRDAGYHAVTARIPHDRMPADDQRTLAFRVVKQLQVLLVTSDPAPDAPESATYFLRQALTPVPPAEQERFFLHTRTVTPQQLDALRLSDFDLVVLADVATLPLPSVDAVGQYISAGGGLVIFPGPLTDVAFYNGRLGPLLPAQLGAPRGALEDPTRFLTLQSGDYTHPIVSLWSDPKAGTLASAHFFRSYTLTPAQSAPKAPVSIVLKFSDGSPAVVSRRKGLGEVVLFASTANTAWNDMPVRPAYVPLLFRTLGQLAHHRDESLNLRVGDTFTFQTPTEYAGKDAVIVQPEPSSGTTATAEKPAKDLRRIELQDGIPTLTYADTNRAGPYEITLAGENPVKLLFATQPDAAESNLTLASDIQLDRLAQVAKVVRYQPDMKISDMFERDRVGKELWMMLALAALALAAVEMVLADWFSQTK